MISSSMTVRLPSASPPLRVLHRGPSVLNIRLLGGLKAWSQGNLKPNLLFRTSRLDFFCAVSMAAGQSGDSENGRFQHLIDKAGELWDSSPEPVKRFPWNRALENFVQLVLDLALAVVKILCIPLLGITSLSEMSYCAHERKLFFVPLPLLIGFAVAGILKDTALEISPLIKEAEIPWHLVAIAIFFALLKFPGPYYPYWGRIFIPHVANGALVRTLWSFFWWYRRPNRASSQNPM
ncbi:hypothetical protein SAY86_024662 [Trapa natans]|uniref:Embryo defective 1273 n=1 Tax=Trapa natans TaxID=22666 RepID=A0AAN7MHQ6_TRANT|nr:hypothetical protein SAY86_024662 [Trapa natans]